MDTSKKGERNGRDPVSNIDLKILSCPGNPVPDESAYGTDYNPMLCCALGDWNSFDAMDSKNDPAHGIQRRLAA